MNKIKQVGRPKKYVCDDEKKEARRKQNKVNQQRCRRRKKLIKELNLLSNNDISKSYRNTLKEYVNQFEFSHFFTGTFDPNRIESEKLASLNEEIRLINNEFNLDLSLASKKRIGIRGLRNYTERYLSHLCENNLISRCFVAFEQDSNKQYHVHILFQSNPEALDFKKLSENKWLIGISDCRQIKSEKEKLIKVNYMVKQINCHATKKSDLNKIDNWTCSGNYEMQAEVASN